jgi:hypothetical protein
MVLVKKVIDIIDIDMFVMFDVVMPIPTSIVAVVFRGSLGVIEVLRRRLDTAVLVSRCLADKTGLIFENYLLGRGKGAKTQMF